MIRCHSNAFAYLASAVKPVLVATSIKQATYPKRPVFRFPIMTRINLPVLSKHLP